MPAVMPTPLNVIREFVRLAAPGIDCELAPAPQGKTQQINVDARVPLSKLESQSLEEASAEWIEPMARKINERLRSAGAIWTFALPLPHEAIAAEVSSDGLSARIVAFYRGREDVFDENGEIIGEIAPSQQMRIDVLFAPRNV